MAADYPPSFTDEQAQHEAGLLDHAEQTGEQVRQTTSVYPHLTLDDAYRVQAAWLARKLARGELVVGHKIGLTSKAMQAAMNIDTPDSGFLTDRMVFSPNTEIAADRFCDPKLEVELAFVLGSDVEGENLGVNEILAATDRIVPAIELIDARSPRRDPETGRTRTVVDTVADNAADAGIICGDEGLDAAELATTDLGWLGAIARRNGEVEETGLAAGVLGHPARGVAWLAQRYHQQGMMLRAGDIVLAGSFTRPIDVRPGDEFQFDYGRLGAFGVRFT